MTRIKHNHIDNRSITTVTCFFFNTQGLDRLRHQASPRIGATNERLDCFRAHFGYYRPPYHVASLFVRHRESSVITTLLVRTLTNTMHSCNHLIKYSICIRTHVATTARYAVFNVTLCIR